MKLSQLEIRKQGPHVPASVHVQPVATKWRTTSLQDEYFALCWFSNLIAMALLAMDSNPIAMASNLIAMAKWSKWLTLHPTQQVASDAASGRQAHVIETWAIQLDGSSRLTIPSLACPRPPQPHSSGQKPSHNTHL